MGESIGDPNVDYFVKSQDLSPEDCANIRRAILQNMDSLSVKKLVAALKTNGLIPDSVSTSTDGWPIVLHHSKSTHDDDVREDSQQVGNSYFVFEDDITFFDEQFLGAELRIKLQLMYAYVFVTRCMIGTFSKQMINIESVTQIFQNVIDAVRKPISSKDASEIFDHLESSYKFPRSDAAIDQVWFLENCRAWTDSPRQMVERVQLIRRFTKKNEYTQDLRDFIRWMQTIEYLYELSTMNPADAVKNAEKNNVYYETMRMLIDTYDSKMDLLSSWYEVIVGYDA